MIQSPTIVINFITLNYIFLSVPATYISCVVNFPGEIYTLFFLSFLLTYSTEQSPSGKAKRFSASQKTASILWKPKVHYRFTSAQRLYTSWARSNRSIPHIPFLKINRSAILPSTPGPSKWSPSLKFPHHNPVYNSPFPIRTTRPAHLILFDLIIRTILGETCR